MLVKVYFEPVIVSVMDGLSGQALWEAAEDKVIHYIDVVPMIDSIEVVDDGEQKT